MNEHVIRIEGHVANFAETDEWCTDCNSCHKVQATFILSLSSSLSTVERAVERWCPRCREEDDAP